MGEREGVEKDPKNWEPPYQKGRLVRYVLCMGEDQIFDIKTKSGRILPGLIK
jgi:hypothetical protein